MHSLSAHRDDRPHRSATDCAYWHALCGGDRALIANEKRRRRRESHNAVERRRRDNINEKISELATLIPECLLDPNGAWFLRGSELRTWHVWCTVCANMLHWCSDVHDACVALGAGRGPPVRHGREGHRGTGEHGRRRRVDAARGEEGRQRGAGREGWRERRAGRDREGEQGHDSAQERRVHPVRAAWGWGEAAARC